MEMKLFDELPYSSEPILVEDNESVFSYNELNSFTNEVHFLGTSEMKPLIFCLCKNTIPSVAGYIAFLRTGIVPLLLDAEQDISLINNLLSIYEPLYIWLPQDLEGSFGNTEKIFSFQSYVLLKTNFNKSIKLYDDLALLLTTSGSTGSPKLVRLNDKNILSNAQAIAE